MHNILSNRDNDVNNNLTSSYNKWDKAIRDAEAGIVRLKAAIRTFKERKEAGEPWPEDEKAGTASAVPA